MGALVFICASQQWISLESSLAHALWRIRGRTLSIDATREAFARALALVVVLRVQEIRRRANTLSWLDAFFVGSALPIGSAFPLCECT